MPGDGGEIELLLRQRHSLEDAVVAAAHTLRLVGGKVFILLYLAVIHHHAFAGDAGHRVLHEGGGDLYGSFSNDVAYAVPDQHFHRDAGI